MKIVKYPVMQVTCKRCDCTFTFNYNDINFRYLYCDDETHVKCPLCNSPIYLPKNYKEIREKYEIKQEDI